MSGFLLGTIVLQVAASIALAVVHWRRPLPVALHCAGPALTLATALLPLLQLESPSGAASATVQATLFGDQVVLLAWMRQLGAGAASMVLGGAAAALGGLAMIATGVATARRARADARYRFTAPALVGAGVAVVALCVALAIAARAVVAVLGAAIVAADAMRLQTIAVAASDFAAARAALLVTSAVAPAVLLFAFAAGLVRAAGRRRAAAVDATLVLALSAALLGLAVHARTRVAAEHARIMAPLAMLAPGAAPFPVSTAVIKAASEAPLVTITTDDVKLDGASVGAPLATETAARLRAALEVDDPENRVLRERHITSVFRDTAPHWRPVFLALDPALVGAQLERTIGWLRESGAKDVRLLVASYPATCRERACDAERTALASMGILGAAAWGAAAPVSYLSVVLGKPFVYDAASPEVEVGFVGSKSIVKTRAGSVRVDGSVRPILEQVRAACRRDRHVVVHASGAASLQQLVDLLDASRVESLGAARGDEVAADPRSGQTFLIETQVLEVQPVASVADMVAPCANDFGVAAPAPRGIVYDGPFVMGPLPREVIEHVWKRDEPQIRQCYETHTKDLPGASGRVVVSWSISAAGTPRAVNISASTLGLPAVEECIIAIVKRWTFPPPADGGFVQVWYPVVFPPK